MVHAMGLVGSDIDWSKFVWPLRITIKKAVGNADHDRIDDVMVRKYAGQRWYELEKYHGQKTSAQELVNFIYNLSGWTVPVPLKKMARYLHDFRTNKIGIDGNYITRVKLSGKKAIPIPIVNQIIAETIIVSLQDIKASRLALDCAESRYRFLCQYMGVTIP